MAVLQEFRPTYSEFRNTFAKRAAEGRQFLLVLEESCESRYNTTDTVYMPAVDSLDEILPLMKLRESRHARLFLRGVLDLSGKFEEQASHQREKMEAMLDPETKKGLEDFYAAQKLRKDQADWRELPSWRRWLTPFPAAHAQ